MSKLLPWVVRGPLFLGMNMLRRLPTHTSEEDIQVRREGRRGERGGGVRGARERRWGEG